MQSRSVDLSPQTRRVISFGQFLRMTPEQKHAIRSVRILPPKLGRGGFGSMLIEYRRPVFRLLRPSRR
jgi:hypothetical protein